MNSWLFRFPLYFGFLSYLVYDLFDFCGVFLAFCMRFNVGYFLFSLVLLFLFIFSFLLQNCEPDPSTAVGAGIGCSYRKKTFLLHSIICVFVFQSVF